MATLGGHDFVTLENIERSKKASRLAAEFVIQTFEEVTALTSTDVPESHLRCQKLERDSYRRCLCKRDHTRNCKFTPPGSISMTTATELIKSLTGNDIKKLSGLDDVKTERGRENFVRMRRLAGQLCSLEEAPALKKEVDDTELYHKTDFDHHLSRQAEHSCSCLTCGFWNKGTATHAKKKLWVTLSKISLNLFRSIISSTLYLQTIRMTSNAPPDTNAHVRKCTQGYRILAILEERARANRLAANGVLEKQQIEEMLHEIVLAKEDLDEYRSHLSRLKTEAEFDQKELEELADDIAKIISDWKMKLLACYFRENQAKFFGKRGVSLLRFMIVTNLQDKKSRVADLKDVRFVMMINEDTLQDEWSVMCAKQEIYSNHLPEFISKVKFQSDGAGCFSSMLNRIAQPLWGAWTGIEKVEFRISPRDGGKSQLDGMFAKCESCCLIECFSVSEVLTTCHFLL